MKLIKKLLALLLIVSALAGCTQTKMNIDIREINKRGNIILDTDTVEMATNNFNAGDIVTVTIAGVDFEMPIGTSYSDVDSKEDIFRYDTEDDKVVIAINGGDFATTTGLFTKETIEEDPGFKWNTTNGQEITSVTVTMTKRGGYKTEYEIRNLERSNNREDYASLTDEQFANFRVIATTGVKENTIYRSSSPIDPDLGRNTYVDAMIKTYGIKSVVNMADSESEMLEYPGYSDTYYSTCNIVNIDPEYDFGGDTFNNAIKEMLVYLINCEKPCLIHCKEGKDRTGMLAAIIELALGASYQEVAEDYIATYENFYKIVKGSDQYNLIISSNFDKALKAILKVEDLKNTDLTASANEYLARIGLSEEEINKFKTEFGK